MTDTNQYIERKIEISSNSAQNRGSTTDSQYNINLLDSASGSMLKLNNISYQNLISNFPHKFRDFSIVTSDVGYIDIDLDFYIESWSSSPNFINFINSRLTDGGSLLQFTDVSGHNLPLVRILSPYDLRLAMKTNIGFTCYLRGTGWQKLGFGTSSVIYDETFIGSSLPNFGQTQKIYIRIPQLTSSISSFVDAIFSIPNTSSFGGQISLQFPDQNSNQLFKGQFESLALINILLYDDYGELIQTVQGNNNKPTLTMNLSIYSLI